MSILELVAISSLSVAMTIASVIYALAGTGVCLLSAAFPSIGVKAMRSVAVEDELRRYLELPLKRACPVRHGIYRTVGQPLDGVAATARPVGRSVLLRTRRRRHQQCDPERVRDFERSIPRHSACAQACTLLMI